MAEITFKQIGKNLECFKQANIPAEEVGLKLLSCIGNSDVLINRYKEGKGVVARFDGLLIKKQLAFKTATHEKMDKVLGSMKIDTVIAKNKAAILCVSDGEYITAYDPAVDETYPINHLSKLHTDYAFFSPLWGVGKCIAVEENPADVKAAEKMARIHDEIRRYNDIDSDADIHDLNIFMSRLLFCFFAEDTGIFEQNLFTDSIKRFTKTDGSDMSDYLQQSFNVMDMSLRLDINVAYSQFPYVNGGLFRKHIQIPKMGYKARKLIIECGDLNWGEINPDIFGSMIQAVVDPGQRSNMGMHYTSVPNIMKLIRPLFLDELTDAFNTIQLKWQQLKNKQEIGEIKEAEYTSGCKPIIAECKALLLRMSKMKFFDPACGSGNFLIISYKQLRMLEMRILTLIRNMEEQGTLQFIDGSVININQFYGIELDDFAHEIAILSLWIAEHQKNQEFIDEFKVNIKALPLHTNNNIVQGNACRLDWNVVCPHDKNEEVFIMGNPPYLGYSKQTKAQKKDIEFVCGKMDGYGKLDYISCWFINGTKYISNTMSQFAFVTTNSITQGEQVPLLWKHILFKYEISFAYKSFIWKNNAKDNAIVAVTIIGIRNINKTNNKKLYDINSYRIVSNISPYLIEGENIYVYPINQSISNFPEMIKGCSPVDDGNLLLNENDKQFLETNFPQLKPYIKNYIGADEFVNGKVRYCLWFSDNTTQDILNCVKERLERVAKFRAKSTKAATRKFSNKPHLFIERKYSNRKTIVVPQTGSEKREYLPMGIADENTVLSNAVRIINCSNDYCLDLWGIIASEIHMTWVRAVAGRMKTDMQYSNTICYNTFPFPKISKEKKQKISDAAQEILDIRDFHVGKTLADLYAPNKMPDDLRTAHHTLDLLVESCYREKPFKSDEERLSCLFKLYEKMTKNLKK